MLSGASFNARRREPLVSGMISGRETPGELATRSLQNCNCEVRKGRTPGVLHTTPVSGLLPTTVIAIVLIQVLTEDL